MDLSIIIVNYNVRYFLDQCLKSVIAATEGIESEIWVVDNHSADGSVEMVERSYSEVKLLANKENLGFSKANNQAIRKSTGEYILLLNPDTVVDKDCFKKCLAFMNGHPEAGALGVRMIDGSGKFLPESKRGLPDPQTALYKMSGLSALFPRSRKFGKYHMGYLDEFETNEVDVLAGAFMLIRKKVLDDIGLLDETFFMYGEDIDLSYRIQKAGYQNYYFPDTTIIHYKGESTKKFSVNYVRVFYQAMIIFAGKHYGKGKASVFSFFIRVAVLLRAALALGRRWFLMSWPLLLDAALIFSGLLYIKSYWEEHIKYITSYPPELVKWHFPYYTILWVGSVFMSGAYTKPVSIRRISAGIIGGTVMILAVYSLFPEHLRFSRGIILTGAVWSLFSLIAVRLLFHLIKYKNLELGSLPDLQTIIVGEENECERVRELLIRTNAPNRFIGFVSMRPDKRKEVIGELSQLRQIIDLYGIGEVIFCEADVPSSEIIYWMNRTADLGVQFKIVPAKSKFIIGSHSKNTSGELYTEEMSLQLLQHDNLRRKRLLDIVVSLVILLLSPLLLFFQHHPTGFLKNLFRVIGGRCSWVGFNHSAAAIPLAITGVIEPWQRYKHHNMSPELKTHFNFIYSRDYQIGMDLEIIIKQWRNLGQQHEN